MNAEQERDIAWMREGFAAKADPPDPASCPAPDQIWSAVRGELPPAELREVLDHVAACPACAEDWRLARAFDEESAKSPASGTAASVFPLRPSPFARFKPYLAAAAAVALVVVGVQTLKPTAPQVRGGNESAIQSLLPEGEPLPADRTLRWQAAPGAIAYNVTVSTENLETLDSAQDLETPEHQIPAAALQGLRSRTKLLWMVEAKGREGQTIASRTFEVFIR